MGNIAENIALHILVSSVMLEMSWLRSDEVFYSLSYSFDL
jgi:hypothetical protein